ncbi:MAG: peptidylprolyl isomerase [Myxococcales bacterium]|nr:peptidylprolyl isomerase [Myxococcales bacterium]
MLDVFRSQTKSIFIYIVLGVIILAFILTFNTSGPITGRGGADLGALVEVDDTVLDARELTLAMNFSADPPAPSAAGFSRLQAENRYEKSRFLFSGLVNDLVGMTPFDGAVPPIKREKVMAELIESVLVAREGRKLGLGVSDSELTARVMRLQRIFGTQFTDEQKNFSAKKYDVFVRYQLGTSKSLLESFLRREILRDKVVQVVTAGVNVSDATVNAAMVSDTKRPKFEYIAVDAASAKVAVKVSDADADAWAAKNAAKVKAAYEAQSAKYNQAAKWQVSGLLIDSTQPEAAGADAKPKDDGQQKKEIDALKADFDAVIAGSKAISGPKGADGKDAGSKKLTEVDAAVRGAWLGQYFHDVASDKSRHTLTKDIGGKFSDAKTADELAGAPFDKQIASAITGAAAGSVIGPFKTDKGYWLVFVDAKIAAKVVTLASATRELAKGLLAEERAAGQLDAIAGSVLAAAKKDASKKLADVATAWNKAKTGSESSPLTALVAGPIGKSPTAAMSGGLEAALGLPARDTDPDSVPGLGKVAKLVAAAWKLTEKNALGGSVFKSEDGKRRFIIRLVAAKKDADKTDDEKKVEAKTRKDLRATLEAVGRQTAWRAYVKKLVTTAEAAGDIDRSDAWAGLVEGDRKRYATEMKRAAANKKALPKLGAPGSPLQINLGGDKGGKGQPMKIEVKGDAPAKPAADKPAVPAAPAAPAAPAGDKPAAK